MIFTFIIKSTLYKLTYRILYNDRDKTLKDTRGVRIDN